MDLGTFAITFREGLESALIVGIMLAYLEKTGKTKFSRHILLGVIAAIVASIVVAYGFATFAGGFEGRAEEIFEGATTIFAAILITTMILWMLRERHVANTIRSQVHAKIMSNQTLGLFLFAFFSVFREGVETVIFLAASTFNTGYFSAGWALLGLVAAVVVGFLFFETTIHLNIRTFFKLTSVILILFSAGLFSHGVHEFEEAGLLPEGDAIWDSNWLISQKSTFGLFMKSLLGYYATPTLLQLLVYLGYLSFIYLAAQKIKASVPQ